MREWDTVAIVGVGLMGGSIGLALQQRGLARRIVGVGRRASSLRKARQWQHGHRYHDETGTWGGRCRPGDRVHACRGHRRPRVRGRPALSSRRPDHGRGKHESRNRAGVGPTSAGRTGVCRESPDGGQREDRPGKRPGGSAGESRHRGDAHASTRATTTCSRSSSSGRRSGRVSSA